jgi:hypothetical protein
MQKVIQMRILSIDFDYFVSPTPEQRQYFPDGGREMSDFLNTFIWAGGYANSEFAAKKCNNKDYSLLNVNLLEEPLQLIEKWDGSETMLYNVDFHHDTNKCCGEIHCGNWLRALLDERVVNEALWINQPSSATAGNLAKVVPISDLPHTGYDLVYICRSGWWTPPHMDKIFIEQFARPLIKNKSGWEVTYQQDILESRYNNKFKENVLFQKSFLKKQSESQKQYEI